MRNKTKRLGALGASALVALVVIGPMAGISSAADTTTTGTATSTTLPKQVKVSGTETDNNNCVSVLDLGSPGTPGQQDIGVTMSADAFPAPHLGDPITLTNTQVTLSIPATLLQLGVTAGIIFDNQVIPSVVNVKVLGVGTKEKSHTFNIHSTVTVHVDGDGNAQPLDATLPLGNTKWTPNSNMTDVFFSQGNVSIVSTINLISTLGIIATATFTCDPRTSATFLAIGGAGAAATTTTKPQPATTIPTTASTSGGTSATTVVAGGTTVPVGATAQLPRTGSNSGLLLALAIVSISLGLFALKTSGRSRQAHAVRARH